MVAERLKTNLDIEEQRKFGYLSLNLAYLLDPLIFQF